MIVCFSNSGIIFGNLFLTLGLLRGGSSVSKLRCQVGRFVHCSTDEVYGEGSFENRVDFDEAAKLEPNNPYAASKALRLALRSPQTS
eukprot:3498935-Amphidinium_carterae.1